MRKIIFLVIFLFFSFCCPVFVFAVGSGGYRNEVVDAESAGKGYCFTAQADSPSAVHYNPAGLIQLKGDYVSLGYTMEAPRFECDSAATGDTVQMQKQIFWVPYLYFVSDFSSDKFRFGFGANSPYGLSTDWANDSFSANHMTESDLAMLNFNPTVAYKVNDKVSVGVGCNYFVAHLSKHKVLTTALSDNGGDFQLKGSDEGFGYNVGFLITPSEKKRIGISYRSEIDLTYEGTVSMDNLNATGIAVFGGTTYTTAMQSKSTIPRSIAVGYAYQPDEKWTVEVDVEWTDWSSTENEFVTYPNEAPGTGLDLLNTGNPTSRDWRDAFAYGIGAEYKALDNLDLRCGFLYHQTPVPSVSLDTPLPDANKYGITLGLGYLLKEDITVDAAYVFLKYRDRYVTNDMGSTTGSNLDGTYRAYVNIFAVGFTYRY